MENTTDYYVEFAMDTDAKRERRPCGVDCFRDAREALLADVSEADVQMLREATSKANLIHLAEQEESVQVSFAKLINGEPVPYSLQTIQTRESDHHHLVIGVKQERDS